jgi:hypothetical protein
VNFENKSESFSRELRTSAEVAGYTYTLFGLLCKWCGENEFGNKLLWLKKAYHFFVFFKFHTINKYK